MPLPTEPAEPQGGEEGLARAELQTLDTDELEEAAKKGEHGRRERIRDHAVGAAIFLGWTGACLIEIGLIFLAWHMFMPEDLHWLSDEKVTELRSLAVGMIASGAVGSYAKKYL